MLCVKLLQITLSELMFCVLGDYNFQAPVLRQVVMGSAICESTVLHLLISRLQVPSSCFVSSYWEVAISKLLFWLQQLSTWPSTSMS